MTLAPINDLYAAATKGQPLPREGMGATLLYFTDRYAATIIYADLALANPMVAVREDHAKRTDHNGMSEDQTYEHTPNHNARTRYFRFRKSRWEEVERRPNGRWARASSVSLRIGERLTYRDPHF